MDHVDGMHGQLVLHPQVFPLKQRGSDPSGGQRNGPRRVLYPKARDEFVAQISNFDRRCRRQITSADAAGSVEPWGQCGRRLGGLGWRCERGA